MKPFGAKLEGVTYSFRPGGYGLAWQPETRQLLLVETVEVTRVASFDEGDALVAAEARGELPVADVDGDDVGGTAFEEHLGETSGRGSDVEAPCTGDVQPPGRECGCGVQGTQELVRPSGDVLRPGVDAEVVIGPDLLGRFAGDALTDVDAAC